jgi:hypothetical protein
MFRAPITVSCASRSGDLRRAYAARRKGTAPRIGMVQRRSGHDDDLYARSQPWAFGHDEPCRPCPGSLSPLATYGGHLRAMQVWVISLCLRPDAA